MTVRLVRPLNPVHTMKNYEIAGTKESDESQLTASRRNITQMGVLKSPLPLAARGRAAGGSPGSSAGGSAGSPIAPRATRPGAPSSSPRKSPLQA